MASPPSQTVSAVSRKRRFPEEIGIFLVLLVLSFVIRAFRGGSVV